MHLRIAAKSEIDTPSAFEQRELALESLLEFCRESDLMVELYENYDGDIRCTNLFETLVKFTAHHALPTVCENENDGAPLSESTYTRRGEKSTRPPVHYSFHVLHRLALSGLLAIIQSIASRCILDVNSMLRFSAGSPLADQEEGFTNEGTLLQSSDFSTGISGVSSTKYHSGSSAHKKATLKDRKERKKCLSLGAKVFNSDPTKCIGPLQNIRLLPIPATPQSMATFIKETPGLEMRVVGEYLARDKKWNHEVCKEFVKMFNFSGYPIVMALREFLAAFHLPGEAQQIERLMESFSTQYFKAQPVLGGPEKYYSQASFREELEETLQNSYSSSSSSEEEEKEDKAATSEMKLSALPGANESIVSPPERSTIPRWIRYEKFVWSVHERELTAAAAASTRNDEVGDASSVHLALELSTKLANFTEEETPEGFTLVKSADTIFILAFSIIMLNTDLHNSQVKNKMKLEEFVRNNRGINDGSDLPASFLADIYESIRDVEIRLHDLSSSHSQPDDIYWDHMLRKQEVMDEYSTFSSIQIAGIHERDMFFVVWDANVLDTLTQAFQASRDLTVMEKCLSGFWGLIRIATYYHQLSPLNILIKHLCSYINYWLTARAQAVLPVVIQSISQSATFFRSCWGDIFELLLKLNSMDLLPPAMTDCDDFTDPSGKPLERFYTLKPPKICVAISTEGDFSKTYFKWISDLTSMLFFSSTDSETESDYVYCAPEPEMQNNRSLYLFAPVNNMSSRGMQDSLGYTSSLNETSGFVEDKTAHETSHFRRSQEGDFSAQLRSTSRFLQWDRKSVDSVVFPHVTTASPTSAAAPYHQLKIALQQYFHFDELIAERIRHLPSASSLALAEILVERTWPPSSPLPKECSFALEMAAKPNPFALPPSYEWGPLLKPSSTKIQAFRREADPIFALEFLTNLVCSRMVDARETCAQEIFVDSLWKLVITHLDLLLRKYIIAAASPSIPYPSGKFPKVLTSFKKDISMASVQEEVLLQNEEEDPILDLPHCSSRIKTLFLLRLHALKAATVLDSSDLMFVERLIVNILRLCIRLIHVDDPRISFSLLGQLHLLAHLHPNIFHLHSERIVSALQVLMVQWNFTRQHNSYGLKVILALFQRMAPIIPYQPIYALLSVRNPQSLAISALECISVWLQDSGALSHLAQIPLYQSVLQTLLVFAIHNENLPILPQDVSSTYDVHYETHGTMLPPSDVQNSDGHSSYSFTANIRALELLANLLPSMKCALMAEMEGSHTREDSGISTPSTETGMPEWKSLWLPTTQAMALTCAFAPKVVRMKALSYLQAMFFNKKGGDSIDSSFPVIEDAVLWKEGLTHALFPLLTYNFKYPHPTATSFANSLSTQDLPVAMVESDEQHCKNPYYLSNGDELSRTSEVWMAEALSRRYTLEGAISFLSLEEVDLRKSDSASFVCRILLSRLPLLISNSFTGLNGVESASSQSGSCAVTPSGLKQVATASQPSYLYALKENEIGVLGYLIPVLTDILSILVSEAETSPALLRDQYLENLKNIVLVVSTTPTVENIPFQNFTMVDYDLIGDVKFSTEAIQTKYGRLLVMSIVKRIIAPLFPDIYNELSSILLSSLLITSVDSNISAKKCRGDGDEAKSFTYVVENVDVSVNSAHPFNSDKKTNVVDIPDVISND